MGKKARGILSRVRGGLGQRTPGIFKIVFLRHGESEWNVKNIFTGWADVDLSETGKTEAVDAGKMLWEEGFRFDIVFTSVLRRAIRTAWTALAESGNFSMPVINSWRLNERHYGGLQGLNKAETAAKHGEKQVKIWRRSYSVPPPAISPADPRHPSNDPMYRHVPRSALPGAESLSMTVDRVLPFWNDTIAPCVMAGKSVLVAAHGNSLRAIAKYLEGMTESDVMEFNIPTGVPLVYELDTSLRVVQKYYLLDDAEVKAKIDGVANQGRACLEHRRILSKDLLSSAYYALHRDASRSVVRFPTFDKGVCWKLLRCQGSQALGVWPDEETSGKSEVMSTRSTSGLDEIPKEGRVGRGMARQSDRCASAKERRTAVSPFRSLPELHPHEVELRVSVKDLSRDVAPEKFRSKAKSVGGFVFGLLVFPQGTKSAPEHARKNRPGKKEEDKEKKDSDGDKAKARRRETQKTEKEKLKAALLKEVPKEKERDKENDKDGKKDADGKEDKKDTRWISAFVEARPSEDYPPHWYFEDVQFLVSLINFQDLKKSIVKHDKHTFSPVESSDGKAIDRGWHDFVHCDEATLRSSGFVDKDDTVCFRASVYLAGGAMKVNSKTKSRYMSLSKMDPGSFERAPQFLNSLVQMWYHLGLFRSAIYGASNPCQLSAKKSRVLPALREIFVRLQHRTLPASCSVLCAAFGRKNWTKVSKADPDVFCQEVFQCLESELMPSAEMLKAEEAAVKAAAAKAKGGKAAKALPRVVEVPAENRTLWQSIQDMFTFEVEWTAQAVEGDFSDTCVHTGPCFTLVVRGFANLEETLDQYFSPKVIEDGSGLRVKTARKFRKMPSVLSWYLKRGDYDCCTGLSGLTETFLRFPRQIDMGKYAEGGSLYHLYAIMVECDDHYVSYIRPEMEGDRGQWYRFDEKEGSGTNGSCGVSNATAVESSFGGEEWLCVNYLYGPSAVLKRPRESRASMLLYLKDSELSQLLREPKLPKLCPELQMPQREHLQAGSVELEAAAAAEAELLNDLDAEQLKEVKKKRAKQKKKQKEKERKNQVLPEDVSEEPDTRESRDEAPESEDEAEEEVHSELHLEMEAGKCEMGDAVSESFPQKLVHISVSKRSPEARSAASVEAKEHNFVHGKFS
ncbi:gpmA [Symbiodinium pilosum]|uniref:phosphoglycerate mutase (2,3-diphosphoglycerate-dependent) n=1 Tax=Symbiodinium pilosum TaxID=2952 RepID=A0A812XV46_SYMPI|nr:gpmA [Symbiodinium pilosum]